MSVEMVLDKISTHNTDVLGCIAAKGSQVFDNLPELYSLVDKEGVAEHAMNMFAATDALETDHAAFDQLFLEHDGHSFYARRLEDGVLVLVNRPIERAQFKKMQIGVNLFMKPLKAALEQAPDGPAPIVATRKEDAPPEPEPEKRRGLGRLYRGVRY